MPHQAILRFSVACLIGIMSSPAAENPAIPPQLKEWVPWVLDNHKDLACPARFSEFTDRVCAWPASLDLDVGPQSARFSLQVQVFAATWIMLPGDNERWPKNVTINGRALPVVVKEGTPSAFVEAGASRVTGEISFGERPKSVRIPRSAALVALRLDGKPVKHPNIDAEGMLWFGSQDAAMTSANLADAQEIKVFRKVSDNVPLYIESELQLTISGRDRELVLGRFLPEGGRVVSLSSDLPARIETDGSLRVQVSAGSWKIRLQSRQNAVDGLLAMKQTVGPWPKQEVWVFEADPGLRTVSIQGVTPIDPQQTLLPDEWKQLPAFVIDPSDTFRMIEEYRGDWSPSPNELTLSRTFWLDFDGRGSTIRDEISGSVTRSERLSMARGYGLGRIELNGRPQLITSLAGDRPGVELRQGSLRMTGVSRYKGSLLSLPASGWDHDFKQLNAEVHLPPGWSVFHVSGADGVSDSWIGNWSLWDLFLLLIISAACFRLLGARWSVICVMTLALCFHEKNAPLYSLLNLLAALALASVLGKGKLLRVVGWYRVLSYALVLCIVGVFALGQIRTALYPQLDFKEKISEYGNARYERMGVSGGGLLKGKKGIQTVATSLSPPPPPPPKEALKAPAKIDMDFRPQALTPQQQMENEVAGDFESQNIATQQALNLSDELYDASAKIQTGPGEPAWWWDRVGIQWSGPVDKSQRISVFLIPPWLNRVLNLLRVAGLIYLLYGFLSHEAKGRLTWRAIRTALYPAAPAARAAALIFICLCAALPARAEYPSENLLTDLEKRLIGEPSCFPECAAMSACLVTAAGNQVEIAMTIDAARMVSVPLPGNRGGFRPAAVVINGKPATALRCSDDGAFWAVVPQGRNTVVVKGALEGTGVVIPFPFDARNTSVRASGWKASGLVNGRLPGGSLMFDRLSAVETEARPGAMLLAAPAPVFVQVRRLIVLRTEWTVSTVVRRIAPAQGSITLPVSLIKGESVITPGIKDSAGAVTIAMGADQQEIAWQSALAKADSIVLAAPGRDDCAEVWQLDASADWHVTPEGIAAVKQDARAERVLPLWKPRAGERLKVRIVKPQAEQGTTRTVESVALSSVPGKRAADHELRIVVRTSQADKLRIGLPGPIELKVVSVDGKELIVSANNGFCDVPIHPGRQSVVVAWKQRHTMGLFSATPAVAIGDTCSNIDLTFRMPSGRWALVLGGPSIGPAMLIWGMLIVMLLASWLLGRLDFLPVKNWQWFILFLGMCTVSNFGGLIVIVWFLLMARRGVWTDATARPVFNAAQVGLVLLTSAAVAALVATIPISLLSAPQMQIVGNGSSSYEFCWYQDHAAGKLPVGWVISLPIWTYRITMLVWSFWMAWCLPRWAMWGWKAFSAGGLWEKRRPKEKPAKGNA